MKDSSANLFDLKRVFYKSLNVQIDFLQMRAFVRSLIVAAVMMFSASSHAVEQVTFQLDWLPGGDKAPIYVGIHEGYFQEEGVEIKIASGRGSTDAITKLSTGISDIGSIGLGAMLSAKASSQVPVTAIYSMYTKPPHAFLSVSDKQVSSVRDLKGKTIATSPFTASNVFLPLILSENAMSMEDIRLIKADPGALGPMLAMGRVDAIIEWVTNSPRHIPLLKKRGKDLVLIPWADAGMEIYSTSLVASDAFLQERPEVVKKFLRAYIKAIAFTQENHRRAAEIVHGFVEEVQIEAAEQSIVYFTQLSKNEITEKEGFGNIQAERLMETWRWVAEAQTLDFGGFNPETAVDRSFLP